MTEQGRRELCAAKLHNADRKMTEAAGDMGFVGTLTIGIARQCLAELDAQGFGHAMDRAMRHARTPRSRALLQDAVADIREALEIAREPVAAHG